MAANRSRLADSMRAKATLPAPEVEAELEPSVEPVAEEPPAPERVAEVAEPTPELVPVPEQEPVTGESEATAEGPTAVVDAVQTAKVLATNTSRTATASAPDVELVAETETPTAPEPEPRVEPLREDSADDANTQQPGWAVEAALATAHLRQIMTTGADQRRYVADLPRRNDRGTYLRLPVHLQDVLSEYCDRKTSPMNDFVAAVLDSYFRDIGALPPAGEGNRPVAEFFERQRSQERERYDY